MSQAIPNQALLQDPQMAAGAPEEFPPLHPDLEACRVDNWLPFVCHRLIHQPYHPFLTKHMNDSYEHKKLRYAEYLAAKKWESLLFLVEKPYRLDEFRLQQDQMTDEEYWENLGWCYRGSENLHQVPFLADLLLSDRPCRERLMDPESAAEFAAMPEVITVYKGFHRGYRYDDDYSFTLSPKTAEWFARRFDRPAPKVLTGLVQKGDVLAYMDQRGEKEILIEPCLVDVQKVKNLRVRRHS